MKSRFAMIALCALALIAFSGLAPACSSDGECRCADNGVACVGDGNYYGRCVDGLCVFCTDGINNAPPSPDRDCTESYYCSASVYCGPGVPANCWAAAPWYGPGNPGTGTAGWECCVGGGKAKWGATTSCSSHCGGDPKCDGLQPNSYRGNCNAGTWAVRDFCDSNCQARDYPSGNANSQCWQDAGASCTAPYCPNKYPGQCYDSTRYCSLPSQGNGVDPCTSLQSCGTQACHADDVLGENTPTITLRDFPASCSKLCQDRANPRVWGLPNCNNCGGAGGDTSACAPATTPYGCDATKACTSKTLLGTAYHCQYDASLGWVWKSSAAEGTRCPGPSDTVYPGCEDSGANSGLPLGGGICKEYRCRSGSCALDPVKTDSCGGNSPTCNGAACPLTYYSCSGAGACAPSVYSKSDWCIDNGTQYGGGACGAQNWTCTGVPGVIDAAGTGTLLGGGNGVDACSGAYSENVSYHSCNPAGDACVQQPSPCGQNSTCPSGGSLLAPCSRFCSPQNTTGQQAWGGAGMCQACAPDCKGTFDLNGFSELSCETLIAGNTSAAHIRYYSAGNAKCSPNSLVTSTVYFNGESLPPGQVSVSADCSTMLWSAGFPSGQNGTYQIFFNATDGTGYGASCFSLKLIPKTSAPDFDVLLLPILAIGALLLARAQNRGKTRK
ncbi:MAG: hypothetical protein WC792_01405 [Candidatus Micrarchaeia archaeon]